MQSGRVEARYGVGRSLGWLALLSGIVVLLLAPDVAWAGRGKRKSAKPQSPASAGAPAPQPATTSDDLELEPIEPIPPPPPKTPTQPAAGRGQSAPASSGSTNGAGSTTQTPAKPQTTSPKTPPKATPTPATSPETVPLESINAAPMSGGATHPGGAEQGNTVTTTAPASGSKVWLISGVSAGAVGIVLLGGGAYFGLDGRSAYSNSQERSDDDRYVDNQVKAAELDAQQRDSFKKANVLLGVGGVALAASVGMLAYSLFWKDELQIFVTPAPGGGSVSVVW